MKTKTIICILLCLLLSSCDLFEKKVAEMILDGPLQRTYTSYGRPRFEGYVKNIGLGTGYNCKIAITCYSDIGKTTIIDTANGFPANLGNIGPTKRAYFEATAFDVNSHDNIKATDYEITWLDRD